MATKNEIDFSYSTMDKIWRYSVGEMADFTGARYDGDFSISLEEAQKRKHDFISQYLNIKENDRVLDIGCGWGPVLNHLRAIKAMGTGITLSLPCVSTRNAYLRFLTRRCLRPKDI